MERRGSIGGSGGARESQRTWGEGVGTPAGEGSTARPPEWVWVQDVGWGPARGNANGGAVRRGEKKRGPREKRGRK